MNCAELLKEQLKERKIVALVGAGGVGKTTISAALGLLLADAGKNVLVLTIDPAKRLADSLGIKIKGNDPHEVYRSEKGRMSALMLDSKKTFDDMIRKVVKDKETQERILNNRYYQYLSTMVTGSHEYMAMEKLYEIDEMGDFDVIVLDTPPSRNAEDFLESPRSLIDVFDTGVLNFFITSYSRVIRFGLKTFSKGLKGVSRTLEGLIGVDLLEGIADFLMNFEGLYGGFRERAQLIFDKLREESTEFLIVTTPESIRIEETEYFYNKLKDYKLNVSTIIFNRTLPEFDNSGDEKNFQFEKDPEIRGLVDGYQKLLEEEKKNISKLMEKFKKVRFMKINQMEDDIHNIGGLRYLLIQVIELK